MTTFLVIDARSRGLAVYTASITRVPALSGGLVLRKAAELGGLHGLVKWKEPGCRSCHPEDDGRWVANLPILLMGEYGARSSAGFTSWTPRWASARWGDGPMQVVIVGEAGFGLPNPADPAGKWLHDSLRPRWAEAGVVFPAGTRVARVPTHRNSNCATTEASRAGVELRGELLGRTTLMEGQSDYASAWEFILPGPTKVWNGSRNEIVPAPGPVDMSALPEEHRTGTFTPARFVKNALGSGGKPEVLPGVVAELRKQLENPTDGYDPLAEVMVRVKGALTREQVIAAIGELAQANPPVEPAAVASAETETPEAPRPSTGGRW